jgi:hypothetical protein
MGCIFHRYVHSLSQMVDVTVKFFNFILNILRSCRFFYVGVPSWGVIQNYVFIVVAYLWRGIEGIWMKMRITFINYRWSKIVKWQSLVMILVIFLICGTLLNRVLKRLALWYPSSSRLILLCSLFFELLNRSMICWHFSDYLIPRVFHFSSMLIIKLMSHISKRHLVIVLTTYHKLLILAYSRLYLFLISWIEHLLKLVFLLIMTNRPSKRTWAIIELVKRLISFINYLPYL